jgi:hypothetical protein
MTALETHFSYLNRCTHCKHIFDDLHICSKCKFETYCSKECQKFDWKRHRKECVKSENEEIVIGRNTIKNILNLPQFIEFSCRLSKEWANQKECCLLATIIKSNNQSLPKKLQMINNDHIPLIYDITFTKENIDNDHFDDGELRIILNYISDVTKNCEFLSNFYINKVQADKLHGVNLMHNQPGMLKKNINFNNYIEKGFTIQVVL